MRIGDLESLDYVVRSVFQESAFVYVHKNRLLRAGGYDVNAEFVVDTPDSKIAIIVLKGNSGPGAEKIVSDLAGAGWTALVFGQNEISMRPEEFKDALRRQIVGDTFLHTNFSKSSLCPSQLQKEALQALEKARSLGMKRGLLSIPTGTGKTILSALDAKRVGGRVLFVVHNNEILRQAAFAYRRVFDDASVGFISSVDKTKAADEDLVFANIASMRNPLCYRKFCPSDFDYIVLDEFHHGAAPSYRGVLNYFKPKFMLGLTATPERTDRKDILDLLDGNCIYSVETAQAIRRGFLVPFTYFGLSDNVDYSAIRHNGFRYDRRPPGIE